jgi:hypothetical protein
MVIKLEQQSTEQGGVVVEGLVDCHHKIEGKMKKERNKERERTVPGTAEHRAGRSGCGRMRRIILPLVLFQKQTRTHVTDEREDMYNTGDVAHNMKENEKQRNRETSQQRDWIGEEH